ncbi:MAG: glycosyltransferase [Cellulosilyticaceae bacterium]
MHIGILSMFGTLRASYSLVHVVHDQIGVLLDKGYEVSLFVSEGCKEEERYGSYLDPRLHWVPIVNQVEGEAIIWYNYDRTTTKLHDTFEKEVEIVAADLSRKLQLVDICIMHDILFQGMHYLHNCAIRKAQKNLSVVSFFSFVHSFPEIPPTQMTDIIKPRYMAMPNTLYGFPTQAGIRALARQYQVPEGKCRVISHSIDMLEGMSEVVHRLHQTYNLVDVDILIVYPVRLSRGKQLEKVVALCGAIKTVGEVSVKVVFCDTKSKDTEEETYRQLIRKTAVEYGLEKNECFFTSDLGYEDGIPKKSILELFSLSNLYVCPSASEAFGLTVLEAASKGNFLILNENVPALRELGKELGAYFMVWDARGEEGNCYAQYDVAEPSYLGMHARCILKCLREDKVYRGKTRARQRFNKEWIWDNQVKPLLDELQKMHEAQEKALQ